MEEILARFFKNLAERVGGPMSLRLLIQPTVATILAIRAGWRDGRAGGGPYLWKVINNPDRRRELVRQGRKDVGKLFIMACLLDIVYQLIVLRWVYPLETLIVATMLAVVPYVLLRGLVGRLARRWHRPAHTVAPEGGATAEAKESR
jgi:hypothetical protein